MPGECALDFLSAIRARRQHPTHEFYGFPSSAERADALGDAGALSLESKMQVRATSHSGSHITSQSMLRSCVGLQRDVVNAVSRGCCTLGMPRRQFNASPDQT